MSIKTGPNLVPAVPPLAEVAAAAVELLLVGADLEPDSEPGLAQHSQVRQHLATADSLLDSCCSN